MLQPKHFYTLIAFFLLFSIHAQSVDTGFNPILESLPDLSAVLTQEDDKILVLGEFTRVNSESVNPSFTNNLVRLNTDGTTDQTFNLDSDLSDIQFYDLKRGLDGNILLRSFNGLNGTRGVHILNSDGSLSEEFNLSGSTIRVIDDIIAFNGGYVAIGFIQGMSGSQLFKLTNEGAINQDFGIHPLTGGSNIFMSNINDTELLLVTGFTEYDGAEINGIFKIDTQGSLIEEFVIADVEASDNSNIRYVSVQDDGKIYFAGYLSGYAGMTLPGGLIRFNSDGTIDNGFNVNLVGNFTSSVRTITNDANGKLYLTGDINENGVIVQKLFSLNSDGTINSDFQTVSMIVKSSFNQYVGIDTNSEGVFTISGIRSANDQTRFGFVNTDFTGKIKNVNPSFTSSPDIANAALQPDGKILVIGDFMKVNNETQSHIARLNADGTTDESFVLDDELNDFLFSHLSSIAVQEDGKILIGGYLKDHIHRRILRLNTDGSIDPSFVSNISHYSINLSPTNIFIKSDGKIIISGPQMILPGNHQSDLAVINSDGSLDDTFQYTSVSTSSDVRQMIIQEDGKIIIGGLGDNIGYIRRINIDGSVDEGFNNQEDLNHNIFSMTLVEDKLLYSGYLRQGSSSDQTSIFIADADGKNANGDFLKGKGLQDKANFLTLLPLEGSDILIGGDYSSINSYEVANFSKVNLSGTVDENFVFSPSGRVDNIIRQDEDHILVLGEFGLADDQVRTSVFRIKLTNTAPTITGTASDLSTNEETALEISVADLAITDPDVGTPDYTLTIQEGNNYTVNGTSITPTKDFNGTLTVAVVANDGEADSQPFNISIEVLPVNDVPVISSQITDVDVDEEASVTLEISGFEVVDPDNDFPTEHTLEVIEGENYTFDGNTVTPAVDFNGELSVNIRVNDSEEGENFVATIIVNPVNDAPIIEGQAGTLITDTNTPLTIELSDLNVSDPDNDYPNDFTLTVESGDNYTLNGATITAIDDFFGNITVPVKVNDGSADSETFELTVVINPVASIDESSISQSIKVYPNPAAGKTMVEFESEFYNQVSISIRGAEGKTIDFGLFNKEQPTFSKELNLSGLKAGFYILEVAQGSNYRAVKKIIVTN